MARHTSRYHTRTDMLLFTQSESDPPTPKGHTSIEAFSMPGDGFESYSPANDPFTRYVEDPPALIA